MDYLNTLLFGIYPYIALAIFLLGSLIRFDREQYTWKSDSSQLLRTSQLRWGSNLFHIGILFLFFGHMVGLLTPHWLYESLGLSTPNKQMLAIIITDKPKPVADRVMADLRRGVTAMSGKGMYTGQDRSILICALTVTEVHNLKASVAKEDPQAFVIVSPAQEVLGRGFNPLTDA